MQPKLVKQMQTHPSCIVSIIKATINHNQAICTTNPAPLPSYFLTNSTMKPMRENSPTTMAISYLAPSIMSHRLWHHS